MVSIVPFTFIWWRDVARQCDWLGVTASSLARVARCCFLACLAIGNVALPAAADERRVALVIGNGTYQHAPVLTNPARDANAIAELLKSAQFYTVELSSDFILSLMRR